jgi:predicted GNAT family N-acyltransferase
MVSFTCVTHHGPSHLDQATRVRALVFGRELGYVRGTCAALREIDAFDPLESTRHILLHAGKEVAGTARLLLPNKEVASACSTLFGLSIESSLDLSPLRDIGAHPAETTRVCVLPAWRGTRAMAALYAALFEESWKNGVTHWVACANAETDSIEDATIVGQIARKQGLVEPDLVLRPREAEHRPPPSARRLFDDVARLRARRGDLTGMRLPRTLSLFTRSLGARVAGPPLYDPHFHMCAIPIVLPLSTVAERLTGGFHKRAA